MREKAARSNAEIVIENGVLIEDGKIQKLCFKRMANCLRGKESRKTKGREIHRAK